MISEITGEVLYDRIRRNAVLVRVNALCYDVLVPSGIASRLRQAPPGDRQNPLTFYTIYYIDGGLGGGHLTPKLVGFLESIDREFFEAFTDVPGVGFAKALRCLIRPINEIAQAIERGDVRFLQELPGIGSKMAERITMELRGKMAKFALAPSEPPLSVEQDSDVELRAEAVQVLEQLEYSRGEALRMVGEIFSRNRHLKSVEEFLKKVFEQKLSSRCE
jgi:holliday junction DNA helicase RuvA